MVDILITIEEGGLWIQKATPLQAKELADIDPGKKGLLINHGGIDFDLLSDFNSGKKWRYIFFDSLKEAEISLESIDVLNNEYEVFDAAGKKLYLIVEKEVRKSIFGLINTVVDVVKIKEPF